MTYAIITNPMAGTQNVEEKLTALKTAAQILKAPIHGLDTKDIYDFKQCAKEVSENCQVLIVAGGDGTFSDILNIVDLENTTLGYLPLGSGNALRYALGYKGTLSHIASQIKRGAVRKFDLLICDGKKLGFTSSIGIDGHILRIRDAYLKRGIRGFRAYFYATLKSLFGGYKHMAITCSIDKATLHLEKVLSLIIAKQPFYGFSMKLVPQAKLNDGKLHIISIQYNLLVLPLAVVSSFTIGNCIGKYFTGQSVEISISRPAHLQIDGNFAWESTSFTFKILPGILRMKY